MHFVITDVAIENILILTCKSQVAFVAGECGDIVLVDAIFLGHDVEADTDTLPNHVHLRSTLRALVHLPLGLLSRSVLVARLILFLLG